LFDVSDLSVKLEVFMVRPAIQNEGVQHAVSDVSPRRKAHEAVRTPHGDERTMGRWERGGCA
jgi:hypothetical protein